MVYQTGLTPGKREKRKEVLVGRDSNFMESEKDSAKPVPQGFPEQKMLIRGVLHWVEMAELWSSCCTPSLVGSSPKEA